MSYNNNLKVSSFRIPTLMEIDYQYNADGRVKFSDNLLDARFDRSYTYDHSEKLATAKTGEQANGGTAMTGPYNESFGFDVFGNSISRNTTHWTEQYNFQSSYTNNRRNGWQYDASGNVIIFDGITNIFDTAETNVKITYPIQIDGDPMYDYSETRSEKLLTYDGDGQVAIGFDKTDLYRHFGYITRLDNTRQNKEYDLKSTVLGGTIVYKYSTHYVWSYGQTASFVSDTKTNIFLDGKLLAFMTTQSNPNYNHFEWNHNDPAVTTVGVSGISSQGNYKRLEGILDPIASSVGLENPYTDPDPPPPPLPFRGEFGSPEAIEMVEVDGILTPISLFPGLGSIVSQCPRSGCGPIRTENGFEYWTAFADGYEGYLPFGANYASNGRWSSQTQEKPKKTKPTLKPRQPRHPVNEADLEKPLGNGGGILDVFGSILFASDLSEELTTRAIVDQTVLITGKGGDIEGNAQIQAIKNQLKRLVTDSNCRKAFIDNGFGDPRELLTNSIENKNPGNSSGFTYTIVSQFALNDDGVARQLGIGDKDRRLVLDSRTSGKTIIPLGLTLIGNGAFSDYYTIEETITHEFIHALGYPGYYPFGPAEGLIQGHHDLRYLNERNNRYDRVINACAR